MQEFYDISIIPKILEIFKVNEVIISGVKDEKLLNNIFDYDAIFTQINTIHDVCIKNDPLSVLPNLKNYGAIFIDDDPNWYTVFNELNIIMESNEEFPLVFICNNNFPHKRRDTYSNPENIPSEFRHEYSNKLPICYNDEEIIVHDGFYHASNENTSKNGVLTAIEDFLDKNNHIRMMKINFIKEIIILYLKIPLNQKRISIIKKNIQNKKVSDINLSDTLIENQLLLSYINKYELYDDNLNEFEVEISTKNNIIEVYKNKLRIQNNELDLRETQINGFESKLNLNEAKLKNMESKLINKNIKINNLENKLKNTNSVTQKLNDKDAEINDLTNEFNKKEQHFKNSEKEYRNQITSLQNDMIHKDNEFARKEMEFNNQIININESIKQKDSQIKMMQRELDDKNNKLHSLEQSYTKQFSKIDNKKYCISCFKEEISNKHLEIYYLKNNTLTKKILSPLAYLYLILKSNPKELTLNMKLYKLLKDSNCFDIGFYLNKNRDLLESKWCKFFSPELHYICNGFKEERTFNKKYFNRTSKEELLEYILKCDK